MAVIVRSVPRAGAGAAARPDRRRRAGGSRRRRTRRWPSSPAVRALLTVLAATADGLDGDQALALLTGPDRAGRPGVAASAAPRAAPRRPSQPPREFGDLLVEALHAADPPGCRPTSARPLRRVRAVLAAARRSHARRPRPALHAVAGLAAHRPAAALAGGRRARRHGRARRPTAISTRSPRCSTSPTSTSTRTAGRVAARAASTTSTRCGCRCAPRDRRPTPRPSRCSARTPALGREWDVVVIAGLQEGLWPNTDSARRRARHPAPRRRPRRCRRGDARVDPGAAAGRGAPAADRRDGPGPPPAAGHRGRQRRRRRRRALPSPFFDELAALRHRRRRAGAAAAGRARRGCCRPPRWSAGCARWCAHPTARSTTRPRLRGNAIGAARRGRRARRRPGAVVRHDRAVSTDEPLWTRRRPRRHAVAVDAADAAPTARCAGCSNGTAAATAATCARRSARWCTRWSPSRARPRASCSPSSKRSGQQLPFESPWYRRQRAGAAPRRCCRRVLQWRAQTRHELTEVGTEVDVDGVVDAADGSARGAGARPDRPARARRATAGSWSSTSRPARPRSARTTRSSHAQLAVYQLAVAEGLLAERRRSPAAAGWSTSARPARRAPPNASRTPLTAGRRAPSGASRCAQAAAATAGPQFLARVNDGCAHCPVRPTCPAQAHRRGAAHDRRATAPPNWPTRSAFSPPTDEQAAVIAAPPGPLVVIAGAGAGKTETMAARVVWLVANGYADPGQVLGLTFTRKAAGQLLRRVRSRLARLAGAGLVPGEPAPAADEPADRSAPTTRSPARCCASTACCCPSSPTPGCSAKPSCGSWPSRGQRPSRRAATPTRPRPPSPRWCCGWPVSSPSTSSTPTSCATPTSNWSGWCTPCPPARTSATAGPASGCCGCWPPRPSAPSWCR